MTFDHIYYFLMVVECKSFSHAAENLFISQSTLSKQIKSLESELNKQLLVRRGAQIELTASGKLFLQFAKKVTQEYQNLLCQLPQNNERKTSILRIGVLPLLIEYELMDIISRFQIQHEHIHLILSEDNQLKLINMLDNHQLDVAIAWSDLIPSYKYDFFPIDYDSLCIVCHRNNHIADENSLSIKDIKDEQLAMLNEDSGINHLFYNACIREGFSPSTVFTSNRHSHLLGIIEENTNVLSVFPRKMINLEAYHNIKTIPLRDKIDTTISLIRRKEANPHLNEFFAWWKECTSL